MGKDNIVLSVIVPAYNAEKTLRRCIDSLLVSGDEAVEIIISNDGSCDNTQNIIDEYVSNNTNVSYVIGNNGGLSCARNRGIKKATGRYITFVDSDDYIVPGIYSKVIEALTVHEPDMLDYQYSVSNGDINYESMPSLLPKDILLDQEWIRDTIIPVALNISAQKECFIGNFVWNKVYKAEIIHAKNVEFDEKRRKWEDRLFSLTFLQYAKTYYSMSEYGYYYVCGSSQTLSGRFDQDILRIIMDSYRKYLEMYGTTYCFDNAYTTRYFCDLLIDVAKDQFAYQLDSSVLKDMFSIFVTDEMVKKLFTNCDISEGRRYKLCCAIRSQDIDKIYLSLKGYDASLKRKEKVQRSAGLIRYFLSKIKRVICHGK